MGVRVFWQEVQQKDRGWALVAGWLLDEEYGCLALYFFLWRICSIAWTVALHAGMAEGEYVFVCLIERMLEFEGVFY